MTSRLAPLIAAFFFGGVALWVPIEKLFLSEIGFTAQTIGLMAAAYAAVVPLLEIVSGVLADRWSRRGVLVIGNAGAFASVLVGGLSTNVATYVIAAMLLGVYFAMQSGTFDAIVYDTVLEETGSSDRFESVVGRVRMAESVSLSLGGLAGGLLASATTPRLTYFATLPFLAVSTMFLLRFREPRLHRTGDRRSLREHLTVTVHTISRQRRLVPIAAGLVLTALLTQAIFEFGPLWLVAAGSSAGAFGPAWAALMASLGLSGLLAGRVRFDHGPSLAVTAAVLGAAGATLMLARNAVVATSAQAVLALLAIAIGIFLTRLLHDSIPSDIRSGVSSGVGAGSWIAFLPFSLLFGSLSERSGVHVAASMLVGVVAAIVVLMIVVIAGLRRRGVAAEGCGDVVVLAAELPSGRLAA
jgi:predicted MFS family arabinose efflux permease